jgi:hypothetical protein
MGKPPIKTNAKAMSVLDDLQQFLEFCRSYGYRYNEADLYNWKSYAYQQFNKFLNGKPAKDMWIIDSDRRGR